MTTYQEATFPGKIIAIIKFLHNAKPYISAEKYENIEIAFPNGTLPNVGEEIEIENIKCPEGSFVVYKKRFFLTKEGLTHVVLWLDIRKDI